MHARRLLPAQAVVVALVSSVFCQSLLGCSGSAGDPVPESVDSDFDFSRDAFLFANFGAGAAESRIDAEMMMRLFGRGAVCADGADAQSAPCPLTAVAENWMDSANASLEAGRSEGFAVLAQLFSMGKLDVGQYGADRASGLDGLGNVPLSRELAYWSVTQRVPSVLASNVRFQAKNVMPFLARALRKGSQERFRLAIAMKTEHGFKGGHSLVPFGYYTGDRPGLYYLRVYDPSIPERERRLEIDVRANTWKYEGSTDPSAPMLYEGTPDNGNDLFFAPVAPRLEQLEAPFGAEASSMAVSTDGDLGLLITDEAGNVTGLENGQLIQGQDGVVMPAFSRCDCSPPQTALNAKVSGTGGTIKVQAVGTATTAGSVTASGNGFSTTVNGVKNTGTAADTLAVSNSGKTVAYTSADKTPLSVSSTYTQPDGTKVTVTVSVAGSSNGVVIDANSSEGLKVTSPNAAAGSNIQMTIATTSTSGETKTSTTQATATGNNASITYNTTTGTTAVNTDAKLEWCGNGKKDVDETDVDCGGSCSKCFDGRVCKTAADCSSANAICATSGASTETRCLVRACTNKVLDGDETDVDCGGALGCRACSAGNACFLARDCDAYSTCGTPPGGGSMLRCNAKPKITLRANVDTGQTSQAGLEIQVNATVELGAVTKKLTAGNNFQVDLSLSREYSIQSVTSAGLSCTLNSPLSATGLTADTVVTMSCTAVSKIARVTRIDSCSAVVEFEREYDGVAKDAVRYSQGGARREYAWKNAFSINLNELEANFATGTLQSTVVDNGAYETHHSYKCKLKGQADGGQDLGWSVSRTSGNAGQVTDIYLLCNQCSSVDVPKNMDGGTDGGTDGGMDGGTDGGTDAGMGGTELCSLDTDCPMGNCACGASSGNCPGTGVCKGTKSILSTPTVDGVAASGTFTVPADCPKVHLSAWGAAGGSYKTEPVPFPMTGPGGAGGFASGELTVAQGDVLTVWIGQGGVQAGTAVGNEGIGSNLGTLASGGQGEGTFSGPAGGGGGGLTSVQLTGSSSVTFAIPGGGGGGSFGIAEPGGGAGGGTHSTNSGEAATATACGGGGAGLPGGVAGTGTGAPGAPGGFGTLASGITSVAGNGATPAETGRRDYALCPSGTASGMSSGNGCVVIRCAP